MRSFFSRVYAKIVLAVTAFPSLAALTEEEKGILEQQQRQLDKGYTTPSQAILDFGKRALGTPNRPRTPVEIVISVIQILLGLLGVITFIFILYAGYQWIMAAGDADKIKSAKRIILQSAIGLLVILSAYAITQFLVSAFTQAVVQ